MMRFTGTLCAAIGLGVAPGLLAVDGDSRDELERALAQTHKAIEVVTGFESRLIRGEAEVVPLIVAVTEEAAADARARDERIDALHTEIALLLAQLDALAAREPGGPDTGWNALPPRGAETMRATGTTVTTGLDPSARALLGLDAETPGTANPNQPEEPLGSAEPAAPADPMRAARARYRAGQHRRALELLEPLADEAEVLYWRARCHEKLEELEAAQTLYLRVVELPGGGSIAERANTDLEFLRWKMKFRHAMGGSGGGA